MVCQYWTSRSSIQQGTLAARKSVASYAIAQYRSSRSSIRSLSTTQPEHTAAQYCTSRSSL
eukprot:809353-Rhodomonas_salina.2